MQDAPAPAGYIDELPDDREELAYEALGPDCALRALDPQAAQWHAKFGGAGG